MLQINFFCQINIDWKYTSPSVIQQVEVYFKYTSNVPEVYFKDVLSIFEVYLKYTSLSKGSYSQSRKLTRYT